MMASLVINSIRSNMDALENWDLIHRYPGIITKMQLKNLELFVLCARKLGNDAQLRFDDGKISSLGSLLQRIHDALPATPCNWDSDIFVNFEHAIADLKKEIGHWYDTLSVSLPKPTFDEVVEILDVIFHASTGQSLPPIQAMIEKITFLRNFIRFATMLSVEPRRLDNLLVHIQFVAVDASHASYIYIFQEDDVEPNIPMIKMVDPQIDETYTQALTSFKLWTKLLSLIPDKDQDSSVIMMDFIDSLLWNLYQRLHTDTGIVISTNSELQLLYNGLRLLRSILEEKSNKFDKKMGELTRVVICDAGVTIFSLYQKDTEDFSIPDLLQRINEVKEKVGGNDLPMTNELGFIDLVLENLLRMRRSKACYRFQSQFELIRENLSSLRLSLGEIANEQDLRNACLKVAKRVKYLIDRLEFGDFQGSSSPSLDSTVEDILKEVKRLKSNTSNIRVNIPDATVGLDDGITSIIKRLTRGSSQLKMVAIVGMPGIGKTTLATKVYNHPSVTGRFHVRLQCCVSQSFDKKKLLFELLNLVDPNANIKMSEQDLTVELWRKLKGKRYLIFLDDVWDIEAWDSLKASFPDDSYKSRILVTSRHRDAVPQAILDEEPLSPRLLTEDQSWELLRKKLTPRIEWSPRLDELGKLIAANCKGLPLTVIVVAGLLANMEPQGWKIFLESKGSVYGANHCMNILETSYQHLPGHLKQCFLYFGLFPEDHEVSVKRLIGLWIAEGFVRKTESKRLEDVARDYMMDLVGRSLVIVSEERSRGGVKACRIHGLLHDFCRTKATKENFFQLLEAYDELLSFEEPDYMYRLCVHSEMKHFKNLRLFFPGLHSLLFFGHDERRWGNHDVSFIIPRCKRLKVLDIGQYPLNFWSGIPSNIGLVLHLKYLSVSGDISDISSSIGSLTNLETFILDSDRGEVSVPDTFWNLQKLKHLDISDGFHLEFGNLENFRELCELQSCSCAVIRRGDSIERLVRKFPNIRKLRCNCIEIETLKLDSLSQLESLHLWELSGPNPQRLEFDFPDNLRKLSLGNVLLRESDVSRIGKLPKLEVLKFRRVDFHDNTWEMVEGEFSALKFLELTHSEIVRWAASDDQFPRLQKLVLEHCYHLEEIPCCFCFENIDTLELVDVRYCCDYVNGFFERIQDKLMELGILFLKFQITRG